MDFASKLLCKCEKNLNEPDLNLRRIKPNQLSRERKHTKCVRSGALQLELKCHCSTDAIMQFQLFKSISIPRIQRRLFLYYTYFQALYLVHLSGHMKWMNHFLCLNFNKLVAHRQYLGSRSKCGNAGKSKPRHFQYFHSFQSKVN